MAVIPFIVSKRDNVEETGVAISEHVLVMQDPAKPNGETLKAVIGVLWDDNRSPSPSYHDPNELVWITVPGVTDAEEEDDEEEEEDDAKAD